jgi:hypothetical protein
MIDGSNGLTSWDFLFAQNKLTMFRAHCPFNPLDHLAESKGNMNFNNRIIDSHLQKGKSPKRGIQGPPD